MLARLDPSSDPIPPFAIPLDENGFVDWLIDAKPGDTLVYYRGHLSHDRMPSTKVLDDPRRRKLAEVATRVLAAESQGLVMPVQRRAGPHEWLYLAIRTRWVLRTTHNHKPSASSARNLAHV
jgi:hypothetical protein